MYLKYENAQLQKINDNQMNKPTELWGTCQMEEQMSNKDIIIKLMLRELIIFLFFLCLFCFSMCHVIFFYNKSCYLECY